MTRELTTHAINPCNQALRVTAVDGPGPGGASHRYQIRIAPSSELGIDFLLADLSFQNGPVKDAGGVNGITHEALLAVLIDRLQAFQAGPYACQENAAALHALEAALLYLNSRTLRREAAGVEGTMAKDPALVITADEVRRLQAIESVAKMIDEARGSDRFGDDIPPGVLDMLRKRLADGG